MKTFYLQNQSGLFLTNDKENRKISVEEQDFSNNQTWFLSDKDGKLFCANGCSVGARMAAQWGQINVESNSLDDDYNHLKFYFHELEDGKFYIGQLEDKNKKFEGDAKQRFLAVINGRSYMGPVEDALKQSEKASIAEFTWKKVSPQQSTYEWVTMPKDGVPENAFAAGEEEGYKVFVGRGFTSGGHSDKAGILHVGKVSSNKPFDVDRFLGFHDENKMATEAFYLRSESGLYLTSSDSDFLILEKLNYLPTQIWYWDYSYDFEKSCEGLIKNKLRCASGNSLYMQNEDDPETIVYSSESATNDNRHKFYSREIEDGNILIGKFTEQDGEKEAGTFVGFCSQGYFKMSISTSKGSDIQLKWKKVPVNQAYEWFPMDDYVPATAIDGEKLLMGRAEVNGVIHPGNAIRQSIGSCKFGYICDWVYQNRNHCNHCCIGQECNSITTVTDEKFTVLCADPETDVEWVELPDLTNPDRAYHCDYSKFPKNAVMGGIINGRVYYVGRGVINDKVVPGMFRPNYKLHALYDGKMQELEKFEILVIRKKFDVIKSFHDDYYVPEKTLHFGVDNAQIVVKAENDTHNSIDILCIHPEAELDWVEYEDGKLPNNVVIAGLSDDGIIPTGIYYVGRATINNDTIPGIFLHKKTSRSERSEAKERTLYALYCGEVHQLNKFQVLVVKKHVKGKSGAPEKATAASGGLKEGDWKLIGTGDLPTGFETIEISEKNFSEHAKKIRSLTLKALEDGTIKFAKKVNGNSNTDEKPKDEASLGDLVGALGCLMTAFAPKEDAEKLQEQVDMMAGLLTSFKIEPSAPEKPQEVSSVVLIVGGFVPYRGSSVVSTLSDSMEVFDPQRLCDLDFVKLPEGRYSSSVHYLEKTGQILICGGEADSVTESCYVLAEGTIKYHSNMLVPRRLHSGAVCSDKLWIFGGQSADIREDGTKVSDGDSYSSIESMSIPGNVWSKEATQLEEARSDGCAVTIDDENILLIGGVNNCGKDLVMKTQVTKFNTKSFMFTTLAPMLDDFEGITFSNRTEMKGGRQGHGSVFIPPRNGGSGHVLVAGGQGKGYALKTAQIYDIDANEWSWAGKLNTERKLGAMVYVNGRIFFMGGEGGFNKLDSIEEYHPEKKTWTVLDWTLKTPNVEFSAAVVPRSIIGKLLKPETLMFDSKGDAALHRENRMGTYAKTFQIIQGCPVFHQELSPPGDKYYLFVGPNGCWRVGPDVTSYSGSVLKNPKKNKKVPPKSGWLYYLNDKWNKDESLELVEYKEVEVADESDSENNERCIDEKEMEAVKTAFAKADTEGTGKLTRDQLKVALGELIDSGHDAAFITKKKMLDDDDTLNMFIEVTDRDGDKLVNLNELLIVMDLGDEKLDHKEMFTKLVKAADKDGNGLITTEELRSMIVTAGFEEEDDASEMANIFMSMGDLRGDKKLKIEEVVNLFTDGSPEEDSKERMKRMFKMYDTNEDGFISKKELTEYIKTMGFVDEDDTPEDVTFMVNMLMAGSDEDKDGKLSYEEFCDILG